MSDDLKHRFDFHPATTEERRDEHTSVRQACLRLAEHLDEKCPDGREKSLAFTKIEEAMFWGNAALARQPERPTEPAVVLDNDRDRWERLENGKYRHPGCRDRTLEELREVYGPLFIALD